MIDAAKLSTKGQIVIPLRIRKELRLEPGTSFIVRSKNGRIHLEPIRQLKAR